MDFARAKGDMKNFMKNFISSLQERQQLCLIINNCDEIISSDKAELFIALNEMVKKVNFLKVVILTSQKQPITLQNQPTCTEVLLGHLEKNYQAKLMYKFQSTSKKTLKEIKEHELFQDNDFTYEQIQIMADRDM